MDDMSLVRAVLDAAEDPVAIVEASGQCVFLCNSAFRNLDFGEPCAEGVGLRQLSPTLGPILGDLCRDAAAEGNTVSTCFSWKSPLSDEPSFWSVRLALIRGPGDKDLVVLSLHEETDHARLVRKLDSIISSVTREQRDRDLGAAVAQLLEIGAKVLDTSGLAVMLSSGGDDALSCLAQHAPGVPFPDRTTLSDWPSIAEAIKLDHSLYVNRSVAADGEAKFLDTAKSGGLLICPIRVSVGPSGVLLGLLPDADCEPSSDQMCLAEVIAGKCASLAESYYNEERFALLLMAERNAYTRAVTSTRQLRALLESLCDAVVIFDRFGRIIFANSSFEELLGVGPGGLRDWNQLRQAAVFRRLDGSVIDTDGVDLADALQELRSADMDIIVETPSGPRYEKVTVGVLRDDNGEVESVICIAHDWTNIHQMREAQLDVIKFVSHDLRTPLTQIMARAQLIELVADKPDAVRRAAAAIVSASKHMNNMIHDITDSARIELGKAPVSPKPIDLVHTLSEIVDALCSCNPQSPIRMHAPTEKTTVMVDPLRLERIVGNLVSNAIKYSPHGSPVLITVERCGDEAKVAVTDRGVGMTPEELAKVFDRYYRAPEAIRGSEGLGLGLFITKSFVEAHGGRIWAESSPGQGSVFHFTLPLAKDLH